MSTEVSRAGLVCSLRRSWNQVGGCNGGGAKGSACSKEGDRIFVGVLCYRSRRIVGTGLFPGGGKVFAGRADNRERCQPLALPTSFRDNSRGRLASRISCMTIRRVNTIRSSAQSAPGRPVGLGPAYMSAAPWLYWTGLGQDDAPPAEDFREAGCAADRPCCSAPAALLPLTAALHAPLGPPSLLAPFLHGVHPLRVGEPPDFGRAPVGPLQLLCHTATRRDCPCARRCRPGPQS